MTKGEFTKELSDVLIHGLLTAPESQLSPELKAESEEFFSVERTLNQSYEFFDYISKQPVTEASNFMKSLCAVSEFYERPK